MSYDKLLTYGQNTPVRTADGMMGLLIRWAKDAAGVQVPGEEDIRWIALYCLVDLGGGALAELPEPRSVSLQTG